MCKFHKDVAMAVATDPVSGSVDPLRYSITLCALAKYWIDKYMPDMGYQDGYSNYEMSTETAQAAFTNSGLEQNLEKAREGQTERIAFLRDAVDGVIAERRLTSSQLFLPKRPEKSPHFLDSVMLSIYEGNPKIEWELRDVESVENIKHKPLRTVLECMFGIEGYKEAIEESLKSSISNLFIQAPSLANPHLLAAYDRLPTRLRTAFGSCSLHGGGGALTHLVVCGGLNSAIGGFSGVFMNAAMWGVAPAVALATTYAEEKYRFNDFNPYKYVLPVAISLGVAFGVSKFLPHEHSADEKMSWFYGMNAEQRYIELGRQQERYLKLSPSLRQEVEDESSRQDMTVSMFMVSLDVCGGELTPKIIAYERGQVDATPVRVLQ
jgi:hypothetical protein